MWFPELASTNTALMQQARQGLYPTLLTTARKPLDAAARAASGAQPGDCLTFSLGMPLRLDQIPGEAVRWRWPWACPWRNRSMRPSRFGTGQPPDPTEVAQ